MGRRFPLIFALLLCAYPLFSQTSYDRGERLYLEGSYVLALDAFDSFIRSTPNSPLVADAQFRRAQILFHLKRYKESSELFQRIELRFSSTRYFSVLPFWGGLAAYGAGDYGKAEQYFQTYLSGNPQEEGRRKALLYLAFTYRELGQLPKARESLKKLFTLEYLENPEPEAIVFFASLSMDQGDFETVAQLSSQVAVDKLPEPYRSRFLLSLGESYFRLSSLEKAIEAFSGVSPDLPEEKGFALQRTLQCLTSLRQPTRVKAVLDSALGIFNKDPNLAAQVWEQGARAFYRLGQYHDAIRYLEVLRGSGAPLEASSFGILAECYRQVGELEKGYQVLLESPYPNHEEILFLRAEIEAQLGKLEQSEKTIRRWLSLVPRSSLRYRGIYLLSWVLEKQGKLEEALEATTNLHQTGVLPDEAVLIFRVRAVLLTRLKREREALATWETYLRFRPDDVEARIERVRLQLFSVNPQTLLKEIDTLLSLSPPARLRDALHLMKGIALLEEGKFAEAIDPLRGISPSSELKQYAAFYLGWTYYRQGDIQASLEEYRALLKEKNLDPDLRQKAVYYGSWSAYTLKQYDLAYSLLEPIDEKSPIRERVLFLRAKSLYMLGKKRDAQGLFRSLFTEYPQGVLADDALYEYANIFVEFEQGKEAAEAYLRLFNQYPDSPFRDQALYKRGETFFALKQYADAKTAFSQYRTLLPRGASIDRSLFWEGMAAYRIGEPHTALLLWERLIAEHPSSVLRSEAILQAANVLAEIGDFKASLGYLRQLEYEYPEEGRSEAVARRIRELELLQTGATEREAVLQARLEEAKGVSTGEGRRIALELVKLYLYERGGREAEQMAERKIQEILNQGNTREGAEARYLLGELRRKRGEFLSAAEAYGEAAYAEGADKDLVAKSLFQALKTLLLAGRREGSVRFLELLQKNFPDSPWTQEGKKAMGLP